MQRVALGIAYNGTPFFGWQTQPIGRTVQDSLESAISTFSTHQIPVVCAGRTDTGVHALSQVVHLDSPVERSLESWVRGVNTHLPLDISVRWAQFVNQDFHARFSALSRTYVYILRNERIQAPSWLNKAGWDFRPLNLELMQQAAKHLVGEHDFSSFRSSQCQASSPIRTLDYLSVEQKGVFIVFTLKANAFLHHMVRNIVGSLLYIGKGRYPVAWIEELLLEKNRCKAAPTFMPDGLYFADVEYPIEFGLNGHRQFNIQAPFDSVIQSL